MPAFLALVLFASPAGARTSRSGEHDCTLKIYVTSNITTEPDGRIAMPLGINGRRTLFVVDTGAAFGVVSEALARRLGMKQEPLPGGMRFQFYNRVHMHKLVRVDTVTIGSATVPRWEFLVAPAFMFHAPVDGLIGANLLKAFDVDIDFAHDKLNLVSQDHCPGQVVYWTREPHAVVPMKLEKGLYITIPVILDGKRLKAVIDTGAPKSFMTLEEARDLFGVRPGNPALRPAGATRSGETTKTTAFRYPFATMTFGEVVVRNPDIVLVPENSVAPGSPQLLLGMSVLRQLHVYIAYGEKSLYLTHANAK